MDIFKNLRFRECNIIFQDNKVYKTYNSIYYDFNKQYNRRGEIYFLTNYKSKFFPNIIEIKSDGIIMENHGMPIEFNSDEIDYLSLVQWLSELRLELKKLNIEHRDIYWRNVLYDKNKKRFTLIDFSWMIKKGDFDGPESRHPNLNPYGKTDDTSIDKFSILTIQSLISKIAQHQKIAGSSTHVGWVYHPIPFSEWKVDIHKTAAIKEYKEIESKIQFKNEPLNILDIGASVGYFSFNFANRGCNVIAVEADQKVFEVSEAIRIYKNIKNISFHNSYFDKNFLNSLKENFDVVLMLNVHMWIYKKEGSQETENILKELSNKTKKLFFQTSHAESGGIFRISELPNVISVQKYLEKCGFKNVTFIRNTSVHGGIRSLFECDGNVK